MRTVALNVFGLLLLAGCHDDVVPEPTVTPTFVGERSSADPGQVILTGQGVASKTVKLYVSQKVVSRPMGMDLRLRIDPAANAQVSSLANWYQCGTSQAVATPTGTPGEWRLYRSPQLANCPSCAPITGPVLTVDLYVGASGTWPVSLAGSGVASYYASSSDFHGCGGDWLEAQEFFGGTITNPP